MIRKYIQLRQSILASLVMLTIFPHIIALNSLTKVNYRILQTLVFWYIHIYIYIYIYNIYIYIYLYIYIYSM